jgi:hypothetical protein
MTDFRYGSDACTLCIMLRAYATRQGIIYPARQALHTFSFILSSPVVRNGGDKEIRRCDIACLKAPNVKNQEVIFIFPTDDAQDHAFLP